MATDQKLPTSLELVDETGGDDAPEQPLRALAMADLPTPQRVKGALVGILTGFNACHEPLVELPGERGRPAVPAQTTVRLEPRDVGARVVLLLEEDNPNKPIVMGVVQQPARGREREDPEGPHSTAAEAADAGISVSTDGRRVHIRGEDEIVLSCGPASITLRRNGKIVIRGNFIDARARWTHRIKGGSVLIN